MTTLQFFQIVFGVCICLGGTAFIVAAVMDIVTERRERRRIERILGRKDRPE